MNLYQLNIASVRTRTIRQTGFRTSS